MSHIHKDEMIRFANAEQGIGVWKQSVTPEWEHQLYPSWYDDCKYIVDDSYSTVRKFFADNGYIWVDGKKLKVNPNFDLSLHRYSIINPEPEKVYYWKWKKVIDNSLLVSECLLADNGLIGDGWTRIESSKTTFEGLK